MLAEFTKQLARDRTKITVSGFTQLGLVEMTRKRTRESLAHMLCEPCPTCEGRGQVKTARSVCYDILREILREARQFNPKEFRVIASAAVVEMLLDEESVHLAGLSEFIGKPISLSGRAGDEPGAVRHCADVAVSRRLTPAHLPPANPHECWRFRVSAGFRDLDVSPSSTQIG